MDTKRLLTITDAARLADRCTGTLRGWEKRGLLVPMRDSRGRRLYLEEEVRRAAETMRSSGEAAPPRAAEGSEV